MAKKKPSNRRPKTSGNKQGRSPAYTVYARVSPAVGAALDAYIAGTKPKPTQTAIVETALEEFLVGRGFNPADFEGSKSPEDSN